MASVGVQFAIQSISTSPWLCYHPQEAQAEVEQCQGSGHEINSWSSITAHMLHVYMSMP